MNTSDMIVPESIVTPAGDLILETTHEVPEKLARAFARSSAASMTFLASQKCNIELSASLAYWQEFARNYFRALCRQGISSDGHWSQPHPPDEETLENMLNSAPPMRGLEYLSRETLCRYWEELDALTQQKATARKGGLASYLKSLHADWNLVGRVTFHLAENKKHPEKPFAFMATFTPQEDKLAKTLTPAPVRHVPLSVALKQSIETQNTQMLDTLLEPVSRAAHSIPLIANLLETRTLFAPQAWGISRAYEFLSSVPELEKSGVIVRVPNWWNASRPPRPQVDVRVGTKQQSTLSNGGLDLQINVSIDGEPLSEAELAELANARQGMMFLRGKWVEVDQERLNRALDQWSELQSRHVDGLGFLEGMRMLAGASIDSQEMSEETRSWTRIVPGDWLKETLDQLRQPDGEIPIEAQNDLQATLRPYQFEGVRWLWLASQLGLGVCLADDMGLGKTIQVITLLLQFKHADRASGKKLKADSPTLLILPTSLLGNWQREIEKFAPGLKFQIWHRSMLNAKAMKSIAADPQKTLADVDVVATTYGLVRREKWLAEMKWRLVILDEAQAIKNAGAAQTKSIKAIPCAGRIALTGTPVENHLGDLWSLFDFCLPGLLGTPAQFKKFVKAEDAKELSQRLTSLRKLIQPYVLRRMKTDPRIISDLPEKTEMRVDCGLTTTQASLYQTITDELAKALEDSEGIQRRGMVLAALMQLKQICNHPALYLKQSEFEPKQSAKFSELASICETLIEKQEKVLVFSQFQSMCHPLSDFLAETFGRSGLVLTGNTSTKKRSRMIDEFQQPNGPPFMVISVKAGGTGLNLTQASHVVHFDRWWNPAVEDQATDRAFRIGQKRNVIVHKFVCRGTLEERIDDMIRAKKQISEELFDSEGQIQLTEMTNDQLMKFISLDLEKASAN
ncbi:DEAD/DEAH box helicase [uncultured Rubinisphaera sp.]|uniref:DEAD/DEAH box helicase n=3 Tax=Rubinisphaera TaxID=1649490 RepID=UPI0030D8C8F9